MSNKIRMLMGAAALVALAGSAQAAPSGVKVGTLTCNVSSGWGFVFGSSKDLHCNFRPNVKWLEKFLVMPRYHHWHHTSQTEGIDKNFAIHFPWIDKLFGTYHYPDEWPTEYGLSGEQIAPGFFKQTIAPFTRRNKPL